MDNLRSGVFRGERGKKDSQTKGEKDHLIKINGWATDYFSFMDFPFGGTLYSTVSMLWP